MSSFEQSYVGQLRKLVGNRRLLTPSARAIIRNTDGDTLFIRRRDNGQWAPPAGFMEMGETVYDAMCREINEETGLEVLAATLVSIYSGPKLMRTNQYGSEHQHLVFQFRVDDWTGELLTETDETIDAGFFSPQELPEGFSQYEETFRDLEEFRGQVILK